MTPEARQLIAHLRRETMHNFLFDKGVDGGTENEFISHVWADHRKHPDKYPLHSLLAVCARAAWRHASPWEKREDEEAEAHDLFSVSGFKLPRELTIPDPASPTRHRKVLTEIAPISYLREQAVITMTQGARVSQVGLEQMRAYQALLKKADGDPQQPINKFADHKGKPKPPTLPAMTGATPS